MLLMKQATPRRLHPAHRPGTVDALLRCFLFDSCTCLSTILIALSNQPTSRPNRSNSHRANHFLAFCIGLPKGFKCPARIKTGKK